MQFSTKNEERLAVDDELGGRAVLFQVRSLLREECAGKGGDSKKVQTEKLERSHSGARIPRGFYKHLSQFCSGFRVNR